MKRLSSQASDRREDSASSRSAASGGGNILMHHSRDTAEKQWAETRFLTLAGVARVFNAKRRTLQQLGKPAVETDSIKIIYLVNFLQLQFLYYV